MFHYTDSGLDNIWLANGYSVSTTAYGDGVSIEDIEGLHRAIGQSLVGSPSELTGAEFRFLRLELDLSQRRVADLINADEQAVRRWEKARTKPVKGAAERMIRVLYLSYCGGDSDVKRMIDKLAELDAKSSPEKVVLRETNRHWSADASCEA